MKDIPVFSCPDGIATLILREVPFRGEGYILVRGVFGTLEGLLAECAGFCRAAGAERLFAAGEADFSGYPAAIRILGRSAPRESLLPAPEAVRLVPVTEETAADWAREYNARFRAVPAAESCSPAEERALAAGGVIGDLIKTNASISGAECGCQAEIGSACSMTAAALGELFEMGLGQIGYAAEVAMEHHLGLTCDPIGGLVQIPCIERNAVAAMRAINALSLANFLSETSKISFDTVVHTMYETGRDLNRVYRETAEGGLAKNYHPEK